MLQSFDYSLQIADTVLVHVEVLDPEVLLQTLQILETIVIQPDRLEIVKYWEVHQYFCVPFAQMDFGGILSVLVILHGYHIPRIGSRQLRRRFRHQRIECLVH